MKKQNWKALSLAALLLASASAFAETPGPIPSGNPASTTAEIDAQMAITRRGIDEMMKRVGTPAVPFAIKASDYWRVRPIFEKNIEDALTNFESDLKKDVLDAVVAPAIDKYNTFYATLSATDLLSPERKKLMLDQQWNLLVEQIGPMNDAYRIAISRVFSHLGLNMYPTIFKHYNTWKSMPRGVWRKCVKSENNYDGPPDIAVFYSDSHAIDCQFQWSWVFADHFSGRWVKTIVNQFRKGCTSQICIQLRANDAATTLSSLETLLSRNLEFKLDDGRSFTVSSPLLAYNSVYDAQSYFGNIPTNDLPEISYDAMIDAFKKADQFGIDDLPFDTP